MRSAAGTPLALAVLLASAGFSPGQKILEENPYYLRADPRLQVSLNVEAEHPKIAQIIAKLCDATGLVLTVDSDLKDHQPDYGVILPSKKGYHAWQLMEMVAQRDLKRGYWDKTDQGYRLMGTSGLAAPSPAAARSAASTDSGVSGPLRWWLTGCSLLFIVAFLCWSVYQLRKKSTPRRT
jgi:hypothetical protein